MPVNNPLAEALIDADQVAVMMADTNDLPELELESVFIQSFVDLFVCCLLVALSICVYCCVLQLVRA